MMVGKKILGVYLTKGSGVPILNLDLWKISPNMFTCLKTLAVMIYPNQRDLRKDFEINYHQHASRFGRAHVDKWPIQKFLRMDLSLTIGRDYSQDGLYSTFIKNVSAGQKAGWMLWTAKRLYNADYRVDNVNRAADLLKKGWEAQNPGEAISQETLLGIWGDFETVAHLWAAYWLYGDHSTDEFRHNGRFDLSFLKDDFPAFLARAEAFRRFGEQLGILSPEETWSVPKGFSLPDVAKDVSPLTDEENTSLEEYHSIVFGSEPQAGGIDGYDDCQEGDFRHSPDYRWVSLRGNGFELSIQQSQIVEILHKAHESGIAQLKQSEILDQLGKSVDERLDDTFRHRRKFDWKELIIVDNGFWRLNL